jgi:hypothetical protein
MTMEVGGRKGEGKRGVSGINSCDFPDLEKAPQQHLIGG